MDHLHIQGQQYAKKAWEKVNAGLERAIGTLNCKHYAFPILLGISAPTYTQEELEAINRTSTAQTTIDGKTKSGYEWSQEQRKLETKIREQKDIAVAAAAEGDMTLRREAQAKINAYRAEYDDISEKANLIQKPERMTVSEFHRVKTERQLMLTQKSRIIEQTRKDIKSGKYPLNLNVGNQNKHLTFSHSYNESLHKSVLSGDLATAEKLVAVYAGCGEIKLDTKNNWTNKEFIILDFDVGEVYDSVCHKYIPTNRIGIHYGKNGVHVIPYGR